MDSNKNYQDGLSGRMFSGRTLTDSVKFDDGRAAAGGGSGGGGGGFMLVAIVLGAVLESVRPSVYR